ncbi:MAG: DUF1302 family protein [Gammaproteobacteria bacterium]|nr:DUF1302 family protein [Gammaproteobacteria bacterium]
MSCADRRWASITASSTKRCRGCSSRCHHGSPKDVGYRAVYAENTKLAGVSFDGQIGQWAVGGEVGYHMDTGLKSTGFAFAEDGARGDTWHALVNAIYLLDRGALWDTGNLALELTYDRLDDVTRTRTCSCASSSRPVHDWAQRSARLVEG